MRGSSAVTRSRSAAGRRKLSFMLPLMLIVPLALAGCYKSDVDLIGRNAARITRFDALLPIVGGVFFARNTGTVVDICAARTRQELAEACQSPDQLSVEPLGEGEYLLQIRFEANRSYGYGLLLEDRQDRSEHCVMWLGAGVFDEVNAASPGMAFVRDAAFPRLQRELASFSRETLKNRAELLRIAAVYRHVAREGPAPVCLGERLRFDPDLIALAR